MGPIQSLDDFFDMLRRRAWVVILFTLVGGVASLVYALSQQHIFRSIEVIQVTQPKIAGELARSTASGSAARRLQLIEQQIMARDSVLDLIDRYDLFANAQQLPRSELVTAVRKAVRIQGVAAASQGGRDDGAVSIVTISADMPTPRQAQLVAGHLADRVIELTRTSRIEQARETLAFFEAREATLRGEIVRVENELAAFRNANDVSMPGSIEFRRSEIATINQGLLEIARERIELEREADIVRETERKATAERKLERLDERLETLEAQRVLLADRKADLEGSLQNTPEVERREGVYQRELDQLREDLNRVIAQRTEAEVGFRLENRAQAEQLKILEPASLPDLPISGSRRKHAAAGLLASLLAGIFAAFLLDLRKPVIRSAAQMERELGFRPVVTVPVLEPKPRRKWRRRS